MDAKELAEKEATETAKNNWQFYNVRGQREEAKKKVSAQAVPEFVKAFVIAEIDSLPEDCIGVTVDAYGVGHPQPHSLTRSINITVVGIKF
jgi:hypothetical protein